MTTDLLNLHAWLRGCLPARASEVAHELYVGRKALPKAYAWAPRDAVELTTALAALERAGLIEKRDGEWFWLAEKAAAEPQKELFA